MLVAAFFFAAATAVAAAAAPAAPPAPDAATLPDGAFCGIEPMEAPAPLSCKLPSLPCGPVPAARIGRGATEAHDDLDGDGRADITLAGRRDGPRAEAYSVIYLARGPADEAAYQLVDYQPVDRRADPQVAAPVFSLPAGPPILRDGFDLPLSEGATLSVARLRRWDGERFRTLLRFCAHRSAPLAGGAVREGHNRVDFLDVDRDGTPEVVLSGLLRPTVFRLAGGGYALQEDIALSERYRDESPGSQKARALQKEASRLYAQGELRRAATILGRAHDIAPDNMDVTIQLAKVLVRIDADGQGPRAVELLRQAEDRAKERAAPTCALAEVYRKLDDDRELKALESCIGKGPDPERRKAAEDRLAALRAEEPAAPPPVDAPAAPAKSP